ncbi:MAG: BamA/TamA family outer membrane protein [Saprospiraceae bacterium]|nr:BamA/TamA family outer membrane protein [Saprospiraceae bacterium]
MLRFDNIFLFLGILLLAASCNPTKYLPEDEYLLEENNIQFEGRTKVENKRNLRYELSTIQKQRKNSNFLFFPREWFYLKSSEPGDTSKWNRWVRRVLGEVPTIYSDTLTRLTAESMEFYLQYKGYYNAMVEYETERKKRRAYVTYYVNPNRKFIIDSIFFESEDERIDNILQQISGQTYLQPGTGLDGNLYEREKERITAYLRNHGYAFFYSNFVAPLEADTTQKLSRANIYLNVLSPIGDSTHQVYYIGDIDVFPDYDPLLADSVWQDTTISGYRLNIRKKEELEVRAQIILNSIYLQQGQPFSQEDLDRTYRSLNALSIVRFVRIKQEIDSVFPNQINLRIELTDNKKMELGLDFELNYTNRSATTGSGNLIGISLSPSLRHRNLLGGSELLISNLSAGVEVNPNFEDSRFWNTIDLRLQGDLFFPRFSDYLGIWKKAGNIRLGKQPTVSENRKPSYFEMLRESGSSRLTMSYNYLLLLDFYRYNFFNASYGYNLQRSKTHTYFFNHIGIDYLQPNTEPAFDSILVSNPFLERSFGNQLFVSLLFRDFGFIYNSLPNRFGESYHVGVTLEMAGAEIWAGNVIYNAFALSSDTLRIGKIDFSQYAKLELDLRYYKQYTGNHSLATRFIFGIARPFGFTPEVPYVKQFWVGGPSSIRGWAARGLGPGGFEDPLTLSSNNRLLFYQAADLKLEMNLEYRFDIFWLMKGALFMDAGNIWTIRQDPSRCGAKFRFRREMVNNCENGQQFVDPFYKQIAVGSGFGLRFDFNYFIFRLDLGVKLRFPFPLRGEPGTAPESAYWNNFRDYKFSDVNFNLGLGYPF